MVVNGLKQTSAFFIIYLELPYNIPWACTAAVVWVHSSNIPGQTSLMYSKSVFIIELLRQSINPSEDFSKSLCDVSRYLLALRVEYLHGQVTQACKSENRSNYDNKNGAKMP